MKPYTITKSGILLWFDDPTPDMIDLGDIEAGCDSITRFNGHHAAAPSVWRHMWQTAMISKWLAPSMATEGHLSVFLHDAHEAYTGDMPGPYKRMLLDAGCTAIKDTEDRLDNAIYTKFSVHPLKEHASRCDKVALYLECMMFSMFAEHAASFKWSLEELALKPMFNDIATMYGVNAGDWSRLLQNLYIHDRLYEEQIEDLKTALSERCK